MNELHCLVTCIDLIDLSSSLPSRLYFLTSADSFRVWGVWGCGPYVTDLTDRTCSDVHIYTDGVCHTMNQCPWSCYLMQCTHADRHRINNKHHHASHHTVSRPAGRPVS